MLQPVLTSYPEVAHQMQINYIFFHNQGIGENIYLNLVQYAHNMKREFNEFSTATRISQYYFHI